MLPFELTKDTPYLALSGELWSVFYEYLNRNWSCYKGFLLYVTFSLNLVPCSATESKRVQFSCYIKGLVQNCSISIANTLETLLSCTKPLILWSISDYTIVADIAVNSQVLLRRVPAISELVHEKAADKWG